MYQIIFVDDEAFVLEDLKRAIDWFGFNMEIALASTDPLEVLDYMREHPVHLILTDISMPQMMGTELIRKAREINPSVYILVLSAYDTFDYVRSAMRGGAENYLLKPLDPDELSESISTIVRHLEDRNTISNNFGPSTLTFRNSFVESWCKGSIGEDELIARAGMLGVNLQLDNYTVALFSAAGEYADKTPLLFDAVLSAFVGTYICHFYFESPSLFICILSSPENFNIFRFQNEVERLRPLVDFPFFVSVGTTADNYADVCSSYHTVKKFLLLRHTSHTFLNCRYLLFPLHRQQIIEQNFQDTDEETYLQDIRKILETLAPERKLSLQLAVTNWGISQVENLLTAGISSPPSFFSAIECTDNDTDVIMDNIRSLFSSVRELLSAQELPQGAAQQYVRMIMEEVHNFSNKDVSLKTLAARLDMHPSYLGSIFHQQTGYYFNDYLNEERLKYAAKLMENSNIRLKDIADMTGFSSQTYFNRQFKKYFNASPNAYRRELKLKKD